MFAALRASLRDLVWGRESGSPDIIQIKSGSLFRISPGAKNARKLIFPNADAVIRKSNTPFNYQIVVTRNFDDGEAELEEEQNNASSLLDVDQSALICEEFAFRTEARAEIDDAGGRIHVTVVSWVDPAFNGLPDDPRAPRFELVIDHSQTAEAMASEFARCIYRSMWERKHKSSVPSSLADEDLEEEFATFEDAPGSSSPGQRAPATPAKSPRGANASRESPASPSQPIQQQPELQQIPLPPSTPEVPVGSALLSLSGDLHFWSGEKASFLLATPDCTISLLDLDNFVFHQVISMSTGQALLSHSLPEGVFFSNAYSAYIWNLSLPGGSIQSYSFNFKVEAGLNEFRDIYADCDYERKNQEPIKKAVSKAEDRAWLRETYAADVEMPDAPPYVPDEDDEEEDRARREREEMESEMDEDEGEEDVGGEDEESREANRAAAAALSKGDTSQGNTHLAVGFKSDRSFVVRGSRIGVFAHTPDNSLKFVSTINGVRTAKGGQEFAPTKLMLHEGDRSMLLMRDGDQNHVYRLDVERGEVVEDWQVHSDIVVDTLAPEERYAQLRDGKLVVGLNHNAVFKLDPRLAGDKIVMGDEGKGYRPYASKTQFTAVATDERGHLAVGSAKGNIRLFDSVGKRAKTELPGLGDPIIGIDVSADGQWVLATCKDYILLVNTAIKGADGATGFSKAMGQSKPVPRRLQLKPEHVAYMGGTVNFTPARFDTGEGSERMIVTSTGEFVVSWNFRKVKAGGKGTDEYVIKKYCKVVVSDNFRYNMPRDIVVATPDNVTLVTKDQLQTPQKVLQQTPRKSLGGKNVRGGGVVNSPW